MSLPKVHNSTKEPRARSKKRQPSRTAMPQGELDLAIEARPDVCTEDPYELVLEFLRDLRLMCQLIEEAGQYGATSAMERKYRKLRTSLARGYKLVKEEFGIDLFPSAGFHGSSFEMIFSIYSLDALVRGPGLRSVERLAEIWRTAQSVRLPERRKAHRPA